MDATGALDVVGRVDGRSAFTTLTGSAAVLAQADTTDALQAAVTALFAANPDL